MLKKPGLDPTVLGNYGPISKLPLLSKIFGKNCFFTAKILPRLT